MGSSPAWAAGQGHPAPHGVTFRIDDLRQVRRVTAEWAARTGLAADRADDFVIAVNEIATNAVRHGSPVARLMLRAEADEAVAEVRDTGCWQPGNGPSSGNGGMGLPLARRVCDEVEIRTRGSGSTVVLRMSLQSPQPAGAAEPGGDAGPG